MIVRIITYKRSTLVNDDGCIGLDVHQVMIRSRVMDSTGKLVMESILEHLSVRRVFLCLLASLFVLGADVSIAIYHDLDHKSPAIVLHALIIDS